MSEIISSDTPFQPRLNFLPPSQRRLWDELIEIPSEVVLYGGTALALCPGHRQSVDFDFFCQSRFQPDALTNRLKLLERASITQQAPDNLSVPVDRGGR